MSFRTTTVLFGLLLGTLWLLGWMLATRRAALDLGFVLPAFSKETTDKINVVEIAKDDKRMTFTKGKDGTWRMTVSPHKQEVKVNDKRVESVIDEIHAIRHSNDDVPDLTRDPERWGLKPPKMTVTLRNKDGGESQFFIGKESGAKDFVFVNSSERPRDVFAVKRASIPTVFNEADEFRDRSLLNMQEVTAKRIAMNDPRDPKIPELVLQKVKEKFWRFEKPPYGAADFEGRTGGKSDDSVSGLIRMIGNLRAEKFEPIGSSTVVVDPAKATLRIEIDSDAGRDEPRDKAGQGTKQVLLIGDKVPLEEQFYARLEGGDDVDKSVVRISSKQLEPILTILKDPRVLRSRDIAQFDPFEVDGIEIIRGGDYAKLFRGGFEGWRVFPTGDGPRPANNTAMDGPSGLFAAIQGKQAINEKDFEDAATSEKLKELEAKFNVPADKLEAKVLVWADSFKSEPKAVLGGTLVGIAMMPQPGGSLGAAAAVGLANSIPPVLKADAKPLVALSFIKLDKDKLLVKREIPSDEPKDKKDGAKDKKDESKDKKDEAKDKKADPKDVVVTYFTVPTSAYEKMVPRDMALAFFDKNIKAVGVMDAKKVELARAPLKDRDKATEKFLLEYESKDKEKDVAKTPDSDKDKQPDKGKDTGKDTAKNTGKDTAKDTSKDTGKDQKQPDAKDDAKKQEAEFKPGWKLLEPKEFAGKGAVDAAEVQKVLQALAMLQAERWVQKVGKETLADYGLDDKSWAIRIAVTPKKHESDKDDPKPFILRLGETSKKDTDKEAVYAFVEGTDYVFLVENKLEKMLKDAEFRDRNVLKFDTAKVKEVRVFVTTAEKEVRTPVFERDADKAWQDKSKDLKFKIDSRKVDELVEKLAGLQVVRYLNVKGEVPKDYDLGDKAPLKFEVVMDDGKTVHTVFVGAQSEKNGPYYAQSNALPGHVFLLSRDPFGEITGRVTYFRKD